MGIIDDRLSLLDDMLREGRKDVYVRTVEVLAGNRTLTHDAAGYEAAIAVVAEWKAMVKGEADPVPPPLDMPLEHESAVPQ